MFKGKPLWIIPIIAVVIIGVTGVFAAPGSMPGAGQSDVALAAGSEQAPQGEHYFWRMSKEQVEMWNQLLGRNPELTEGELLNQVAPEVLEHLEDMDSNFVGGFFKSRACPWDPENPPMCGCIRMGKLPPGWCGAKRDIYFDEQGNPIFTPVTEMTAEEIAEELGGNALKG